MAAHYTNGGVAHRGLDSVEVALPHDTNGGYATPDAAATAKSRAFLGSNGHASAAGTATGSGAGCGAQLSATVTTPAAVPGPSAESLGAIAAAVDTILKVRLARGAWSSLHECANLWLPCGRLLEKTRSEKGS